MRYNFYDTKRAHYALYFKTKDMPLPADINEPVERMAKALKDEILLRMIVDARIKKLFGNAVHIVEREEGKGLVSLKYHFENGICTGFTAYEQYDSHNYFERTVCNDNVDMRRPKQGEHEQNKEPVGGQG